MNKFLIVVLALILASTFAFRVKHVGGPLPPPPMEVGDDWVDPCPGILPEDPEDMTEELQEEHHLCMDDFFAANGEVASRIQQEDVADMQGPECDIEADDFEDCMTEFAEANGIDIEECHGPECHGPQGQGPLDRRVQQPPQELPEECEGLEEPDLKTCLDDFADVNGIERPQGPPPARRIQHQKRVQNMNRRY